MRKILALFTVSALLLGGCVTTQQGQTSKTVTGAAIGAVAGGVLGAATGPKGANKGERVLIGAVAGAIIGGTIGYILDQQAKQMGEDLGVKPIDNTNPESPQVTGAPITESKPVAVVKEPNRVRVVLKDSLLFDLNSYQLKPEARETLRRLARTLSQNPDNVIVVAGFTDSTGSFDYNVKLSEKRAESVKNELVLNGVDPTRVLIFGCGPKKPIAPNNTPEGRSLNRRVEILVYPKGVTIPHPCN